MKNFLLTSTMVLGMSASLLAQDAVFKVMATKGEVIATKPTSPDARNVIISGKKLYKNETLQLGSSGFVGLMHKSGKTMELRNPGPYQISTLDAELSAQASSSVTQRYANYVFDEITKDGEKDTKKNHQQYMAVTGAVDRGTRDRGRLTGKVVHPLIPKTTAVLAGSTITLSWFKFPGENVTYLVNVNDLYDEIVLSKETSDTSLLVDFSKFPKLKNEKMCLVRISVKGNPSSKSNNCAIKFVQSADALNISKDLASMRSNSENTSISKVAQAYFFEQNQLYLDAINSYQAAIQMEPGVDDYKELYNNFLTKVGLLESKVIAEQK